MKASAMTQRQILKGAPPEAVGWFCYRSSFSWLVKTSFCNDSSLS